MKVICVVILLVVSALLSRGPGVATQGSNISSYTAPSVVSDVNQNNITPASGVQSTRLNPPHGQPGHRCDISVGQPLDGSLSTQPSSVNTLTTGATQDTKPAKPFKVPVIEPALNTATSPAINNTSGIQQANGLNPPHGQPGHRCDIAVGKPLNSKAAVQTTTSTAQTVNTSTATTAPPATSTANVASGLNPKHGQPGHRCDIMVGQPLNSKPSQPAPTTNAAPAANPAATTTSTSSPAIWTAPSATTASPGANKTPKLNPKHGQPGHRCDILVGQPLDSKPAQ
jgi:hypothetical protein